MGRAATVDREERLHAVWGKRIRSARRAKEFTQEELADALGVNQNTVSRIETGRVGPSDRLKFRLCEILERDLDELFAWPEHFPPEHEEAVA